MKNNCVVIALATAFVTVGCIESPHVPSPTLEFTPPALASTATRTSKPVIQAISTPTLTPWASATPTATMLPSPSAEAKLKVACLDIAQEPPAQGFSKGIVFASGKEAEVFQLDMANPNVFVNTGIKAVSGFTNYEFVLSPDSTQLAYVAVEAQVASLQKYLVIAEPNGQPLTKIIWEEQWVELIGWLDNEYLVVNLGSEVEWGPAKLLLVQPFTGEKQDISISNLPALQIDPRMTNWMGWDRIMYDATLSRIIYAYWDQENFVAGYRLWDVQAQRPLTYVPASDVYNPPQWFPDGTQFVVAANAMDLNEAPWLSFELYGVDREGKRIEPLTHLSAYYARTYIDGFSIAPDGKHIAFWLVENPVGEDWNPAILGGTSHLVILDMTSGEVTNTCIEGDYEVLRAAPPIVPAPLWSPDSQHLLIVSQYAENESSLVLVDTTNYTATRIAQNMYPLAWLNAAQP